MNEFISFDKLIGENLHFSLTRSAFASVGGTPAWAQKLSQCKRFLITLKEKQESDGEFSYNFIFGGKVLTCILKDQNKNDGGAPVYSFLITYIADDDFTRKQNMMRNGICFLFQKDVSVSFFDGASSFYYRNGELVTGTYDSVDCTRTAALICEQFHVAGVGLPNRERYEPTPQLEEYLNIARQYSDLEFQREEEHAQMNAPLQYSGIFASDYFRNDNTVYRFDVGKIDTEIYTLQSKVELRDINGEVCQATIVDIRTEGSVTVDLLFNEQISLDALPGVGTISLSFSSVCHDVQTTAIEKLREGKADALYMDDILGTATPKGFDEIDLTALDEALDLQKYPPNPSQRTAIFNGIRTKDAYLVMGPPGTGKTTVILEWIKYFVQKCNMRVLVSSQNNKAVDNVLERIIEEKDIDVLRIGSESKVTSTVLPCLFENKMEELRTSINDTTRSNILALRKYINRWEDNLRVLTVRKSKYEQLNTLHERARQASRELSTLWIALQKHLKDCEKTQRALLHVSRDVNALIEKEDRYRKRGAFGKFVLGIFSKMRNRSIAGGIEKYDRLREEETLAIQRCRDGYLAYRKAFDDTVRDISVPTAKMKEDIDFAVSFEFQNLDSESAVFHEFDLAPFRAADRYDVKFWQEMTDALRAMIDRAQELLAVIERWRDDAISTRNYTLKNILLEGVNLVGATCIGINSQQRFADLKFDVTIIDESGQIQIHNALVPMSVSNKLIMLGDHKQIPPVADPEMLAVLDEHGIDDELMRKSLFEIMYERLPDTNKSMLDTQFRMPGEIADILSDWFYGGEYKSHKTKRDLSSEIPGLSEKPFLIIDTSDSMRRLETNHKQADGQTTHDNPLEAEIIADIIGMLHKSGYPLSDVGVISALKAQVELIRSAVCKKGIAKEEANELVATLDSYQGQERKIILYSFGRSSLKAPSKNGVGFLTELRRLNVAMSRCKKTLIMLGDMKFLASRDSVLDYQQQPLADESLTERNFAKFIQHMLAHVENGAGERISYAEFCHRFHKMGQSL